MECDISFFGPDGEYLNIGTSTSRYGGNVPRVGDVVELTRGRHAKVTLVVWGEKKVSLHLTEFWTYV